MNETERTEMNPDFSPGSLWVDTGSGRMCFIVSSKDDGNKLMCFACGGGNTWDVALFESSTHVLTNVFDLMDSRECWQRIENVTQSRVGYR